MSEFSDRALVAGSVVGVREFAVRDGLLVGPLYAQAFTSEENLATCHTRSGALGFLPLSLYASMYASLGVPVRSDHRAGSLTCTCGFYAYFDRGPNTFHRADTVTAVVEGSGICTVGQRGFRAEKARLLALVDPYLGQPSPSRLHDAWDRWSDWHYRGGWRAGVLLFLSWVATTLAVFGFEVGPWLGVAGCALAVAAWAAAISGLFAGFHGINRRYATLHPELTCSDRRIGRGLRDLGAQYADVPRFSTLDEALDAFPLTPPDKQVAS